MTDEQKPQVVDESPMPSHDDFWKQQYEEATTGSGNNFLFFKAEKTRVRLIGVGPDRREWVRQVENVFRGKPSIKYLALGYEIIDPKSQAEFTLQAVVFTKGAWGGVSNMMLEGYDLFGPEGVGLTVNRQNIGGRTSYTVLPAPTKVPIPAEIMIAAEEASWDFYLEEYRKMQEGRSDTDTSNATNSIADQIVNAPASSTEW